MAIADDCAELDSTLRFARVMATYNKDRSSTTDWFIATNSLVFK